MRRSTPAMGDGVQARLAAWTTARREKSAFSSMASHLLLGVRDARALSDAAAQGLNLKRSAGTARHGAPPILQWQCGSGVASPAFPLRLLP